MSDSLWKDEKYVCTDDELSDMIERSVVKRRWYLRLPVIRHIRAIKLCSQINAHYDRWAQLGAIGWNAASDYKIARAIWDGKL